mmetsp:Transcript_1255/g.2567  ORF Transcript_1255/g.2567 Transcript_1255/m.2567 type:complete len:172 (+) Transcript_1255:211-726(+)
MPRPSHEGVDCGLQDIGHKIQTMYPADTALSTDKQPQERYEFGSQTCHLPSLSRTLRIWYAPIRRFSPGTGQKSTHPPSRASSATTITKKATEPRELLKATFGQRANKLQAGGDSSSVTGAQASSCTAKVTPSSPVAQPMPQEEKGPSRLRRWPGEFFHPSTKASAKGQIP